MNFSPHFFGHNFFQISGSGWGEVRGLTEKVKKFHPDTRNLKKKLFWVLRIIFGLGTFFHFFRPPPHPEPEII